MGLKRPKYRGAKLDPKDREDLYKLAVALEELMEFLHISRQDITDYSGLPYASISSYFSKGSVFKVPRATLLLEGIIGVLKLRLMGFQTLHKAKDGALSTVVISRQEYEALTKASSAEPVANDNKTNQTTRKDI